MSGLAMECRACGCTQDRACALMMRGKLIGACSWVEGRPRPLCSACVPGSAARASRQLALPGVKEAAAAHWVRQRRAHVADGRRRKERTT